MKIQVTDLEKCLWKNVSFKGLKRLASRIYKEHLKLNSEKTKHQFINGQRFEQTPHQRRYIRSDQ